MTALTMPARPGHDAGLRPVPWRRMAWVTWRQHRIALAGVAALLGALGLYLLITGLQIHHAYAAVTACHPVELRGLRAGRPPFVNDHNTAVDVAAILLVIPVLIGAFVGAPLLARELETGTFRFAWTQGFGRWRWTVAKLALLAIAVTAAAGAFSLLFSWYYQPFLADRIEGPLAPQLFNLRGVDFAAWTLVAFALGAIAGVLIRRTVPAMAASLAAWAGLDLATTLFLRKHYQRRWSSRAAPATQPALGGQPVVHRAERRESQPANDPQRARARTRIRAELAQPERGDGLPLRASLHAVVGLPAGEPVLALPAHRGRLAAASLAAPDRRHRLAGPPPRRLNPGNRGSTRQQP